MNPGATRALETERIYSEAREALSLAVCERALWSVKCSVVRAVKSSWRSGASATSPTYQRRPTEIGVRSTARGPRDDSARNAASVTSNVSAPPSPPAANCDPSYPTVCIPPPPPDLACTDIPYRNFTVVPPDSHGFDGDKDGIGCES
jgi:hypothetical protein